MSSNPPVWQMIKEAVEKLDGKASYTEIIEYIRGKYGDVNESTIRTQTRFCSVNAPSRINFTQNKKPRLSNSQYDFLFNLGGGEVVSYDREEHGIWEIREDKHGKLVVAQKLDDDIEISDSEAEEVGDENLAFAFEAHLRDFIAQNIESIKVGGKSLKLYVDEHGRDGIEYPTEVGPIDILAIDEEKSFVVFELKLSKGPDKAMGQISRYMGWIARKLAEGRKVKGVIVAQEVSEKLKYAASIIPQINLFEYEIDFKINAVNLDD